MASLILFLTSRGIGIREAISVCQSHSQWALFYILEQDS